MPDREEIILPDPARLAKQIAAVRTRLGRKTRKGSPIPDLEAIAQELATDPDLPVIRLVQELMEDTIDQMGSGELARLARLEFGLVIETKEEKYLNARQEKTLKALKLESHDTLKARETETFEVMAKYLLRRVEAHRTQPTTDEHFSTQPQQPRYSSHDKLVHSLLTLHYAGQNCSLLPRLNGVVTPTKELPHSWQAWEDCAFQMYSAYIHFLESFGINTVYFHDFREDLDDEMASDQIDALNFLIRTIAVCPPPPNTREHLDFYIYAWDGGQRDRIHQHFEETWIEWYHANLQHETAFCGREARDFVSPPGIDVIVAKTDAATKLMLPYVTDGSDIVSKARVRALKELSLYYDFDDVVPISGGPSLRQRAEGFYSKHAAELAKNNLACYDNKEWYDQEPQPEPAYEVRRKK